MAKRAKNKRRMSREDILRAAAKKSTQRRRRWRRAVALTFLVIGVPTAMAVLTLGARELWKKLFLENDYFQIQRIEVTTDGALSRADICEYARVAEGLNLFAVQPSKIRGYLQRVPVIAQAQVGRRLPDTLIVEVTERVAIARLGRPGTGSPLAVDATGHVLGPSSVRPALPAILGIRDSGLRPGDVIKDSRLMAALEVLEITQRPELRADLRVTTVDVANPDQLEVGLVSGERVLLSYDRLAEKLGRLKHMRAAAYQKNRRLSLYDMTADRNYAGRPAEAPENERARSQ